eukprot:superscaffoldBa00003310_g16615
MEDLYTLFPIADIQEAGEDEREKDGDEEEEKMLEIAKEGGYAERNTRTSYVPLTPSCAARSNCIDLSAKWYVVLLFPRDSDVLSPLRCSLCLTQLQWEI